MPRRDRGGARGVRERSAAAVVVEEQARSTPERVLARRLHAQAQAYLAVRKAEAENGQGTREQCLRY